MRVVIQRAKYASVTIDNVEKSRIGKGLFILVGFEAADTADDVAWMTRKVLGLRIFDDENGVMNRSVMDIDGEILIVSQFTLHALTAKATVRRISRLPDTKSQFRSTRVSFPR